MGSAFLVKFGNHAGVKVPVSLCLRCALGTIRYWQTMVVQLFERSFDRRENGIRDQQAD